MHSATTDSLQQQHIESTRWKTKTLRTKNTRIIAQLIYPSCLVDGTYNLTLIICLINRTANPVILAIRLCNLIPCMWLSVMAKISCPGIVFPDKEDSAGGTLSFYCYGLGIALSVVLLLLLIMMLLLLLLLL